MSDSSTNETDGLQVDAVDEAVIDTVKYLLENIQLERAPEDHPSPRKPEPETVPLQHRQDEDRDIFKLKAMQFNTTKMSIVTQNLNGPCPLIALVNVLALKGLIWPFD
ncbi:hypothetical protein GCK32_007987 [Trichostrongylus colubriformis]|uniref:Ubiquitin carboxyl-terminal hydrolase n=1 Tax=Trichostrongylus colubriformis TaxID=6319 RepID=A0AAN8G9P3_TRICO